MNKPLTPRFHGNGFIQVYMSPDVRLHIWSKDFPATRVQNARIHDHRFTFNSTVLIGTLRHEMFAVKTHHDGNADLWQQGTPGSKSSRLELIGPCLCSRIGATFYEAGTTYGYGNPGMFHDSSPDSDLAVTMMVKTSVVDGYRAQIVCLDQGSDIEHAFDNQPDEQDMREEVGRVMRLLI